MKYLCLSNWSVLTELCAIIDYYELINNSIGGFVVYLKRKFRNVLSRWKMRPYYWKNQRRLIENIMFKIF